MEQKRLFDIFSAKAEYNPLVKDMYNRTSYYNYRNGDIFSPEVSQFIYNEGFKPIYPDGNKFAVCLSHDVDVLFSTKHEMKNGGLKYTGGFINLFNLTKYEFQLRLKKPNTSNSTNKILNPNYNLIRTIEKEQKINAVSSFYFLSLTEDELDFNYGPTQIKGQFKLVIDAGSEIGLHGGHEAYASYEKIGAEINLLEKAAGVKIKGHRNHYLKFTTPNSWYNQARAGLVYDTTFGYADCAGFRNGMCYPYMPYDLSKKEFIDIIELPLIIMDVSLFNYMRLTFEESRKLIENLVEKIKSINGVVTFLWHNTYMDGEMGKFYEMFLDYISKQDAWITTSDNLVEWYKEQRYLNQIKEIIENRLISKNGN